MKFGAFVKNKKLKNASSNLSNSNPVRITLYTIVNVQVESNSLSFFNT